MKKIDIGVIVTTLIIVTISCSLAFFAARVVGNPKDINLVAKNVAITFTDTSSIASNETISPGWNNVKTFTIANNSKEDFSYNIILKGLVNTFESINTLQYKITSDNGYNVDNYLNVIKTESSKDVVLAYNITIPKNTIQSYQVEFNYISKEEDQSVDMGKKLSGTLAIETSDGSPKIYYKLLADNPTIKIRTNFSTIFNETNVNTLYKATEDNTDVYYFAGDARNNWVKFGGYYWRIIRTNSDGSIRLLYAGISTDATDGFIGTSAFNTTYNSPKYVGYMYGEDDSSLDGIRANTNNSTIKTYIDNWYSTNLINYTKYLSTTAVYCNDRSNPAGGYNTGENTIFYYAAYTRLNTNKTPSYDCTATEDKFTVDSSIGNGKLTYPIALMTADEIAFAGGVYRKETSAWYYYNSANGSSTGSAWWWLLSPYGWSNGWAYVLSQSGSGAINTASLNFGSVKSTNGVIRPVISLKSNVVWLSGDGTATNPYQIVGGTASSGGDTSDNN